MKKVKRKQQNFPSTTTEDGSLAKPKGKWYSLYVSIRIASEQ